MSTPRRVTALGHLRVHPRRVMRAVRCGAHGAIDRASPARRNGTTMAALTVWKFQTPYGADAALEKLKSLATQQLITVQDAAVVSWEEGRKKPKTRELHDTRMGGALRGGFWGLR